MINNYQSKLTDIYLKIQEEEQKSLRHRKEEIQKLYPKIIELDNEIQKLSINMSMAILHADDGEKVLNEYKNKIMNLRAQKYEMLV